MKKLAAGLIVGLLLGIVFGYQFAPRTDTGSYEGTIDLLLEELSISTALLDETKSQVSELENTLEVIESELEQAVDEIEFLKDTFNTTTGDPIGPNPENVTITETAQTVVHQLQNYDLDALEAVGADIYIIDYSKEGDEETRFSSGEIQSFNSTVLSYISIGEAEDYRWYWQEDWTEGEPAWLGDTNPEWEGNYKVRYWDPDWQEIVFDYVFRIMESGFNGIYLDIIDAYEYWGPDGDSGLDRETAEQEMVNFVVALSEYTKSKDPDFLIYPQNGEALGVHPEYLAAVDGIGREDVWYNDNALQPDTHTTQSYLQLFSDAGKQVIVVDYPTETELILDFCEKAKELGYIPYPGGRDLNDIRLCPE